MSAVPASIHESLFAFYPDAMLLVDDEGRIVLANPAAARLLGYTVEALAGLSIDALVPDGDRPRHASYRAAYARDPRPRPMGTRGALVARRRDGSEVQVEIALSPLRADGRAYAVAAIRDVGDYPRVQEALRRARYAETIARMGRLAVDARETETLLRSVPAAAAEAFQVETGVLYLLEPGGRAFRVVGGVGLLDDEPLGTLIPNRADTSPGFLALHGEAVVIADYRRETRFQPRTSILARGLVSGLVVPLVERGSVIGALALRSSQQQRFGEEEKHFLGSLANLVATVLQRDRSEAAFRHAQRLETVGQLTGGIAHDFNNLLTVIRGNLEMLEELPSVTADEFAVQLGAAAMRATRRGADLTGKLLAFSRRQLLRPEAVDLQALLQSLADMLRRTFDKRIHIEVRVAPGCPACRADPGQLENALLNIAVNARDAMPDGGTLRFAAAAAADDTVEIAVSDTGEGMPEHVQQRAFEPFFTTKEAGRGTGLGLSTVYGFARQSGGDASIDSVPGGGTTVSLRIPAVAVAGAEPRPAAPVPATSLPPGLRVLLVEDDAEVRAVIRSFLQTLHCEVTAAGSAAEALALLEHGAPPALLLSDIALGPGLRGTELAAQVRQRWPALPVLLMSAYPEELLSADRQAAPTWTLLRKPCTRDELARAVAGVLGTPRS